MRTLLRKMSDVMERITGAGAVWNAWQEVDRAASSRNDLDAQLHRLGGISMPHAA